jgi:drug/metabolite transporter (DMT)-like permease
LEEEETSLVVPFFQSIPVFGFLFGYILLGETLSKTQLIGCSIVILGAIILSLEINELKRLRFKRKLFLVMISSSFFYAAYEALFKLGAIDDGFWVATFWQYFGLFIFGIIIFAASKRHRKDFIYLLKRHNWRLFSLNITNEGLTIVGNTAYNFALLLAPVALVMTTTGYQPVLVFIEAIIFTIFFPKLIKERVGWRHLLHKILAVLVVFIGTWILYNN